MKFDEKLLAMRKNRAYPKRNLGWSCRFHGKRSRNGRQEFPIVKDTTPNMMNPRLYIIS